MTTEHQRRRQTTRNKLLAAGVPEVCLPDQRRTLVGYDFTNSNNEKEWVDANFIGDDLEGAVFDGLNLERTKFNGANLRGASFRGCTLTLTIFLDAKCQGADFTEAKTWVTDFRGTNLTGAKITPEQLARSRSDETTEFDPELWGNK